MFYSFGGKLVKIQFQHLFRESVVYVILGVLVVIFMVEWLVMIKQWCHILCVTPLKKNMKWMNSIDLMRQTNEMTNLEDYGGVFTIPFLCFRFLSLH